jgi:hypothetical protein
MRASRPRTAARLVTVSALLLPAFALAGCGSSEPAALPHDAAFRSCLTNAGVSPDKLDSVDARRTAFREAAPWGCLLTLRDVSDRRAVLDTVFTPDSTEVIAPLTAWLGTAKGAADDVARDLGTLLASTDTTLPHDKGDAADLAAAKTGQEERLAIPLYQRFDGALPGYATYMAQPEHKNDPRSPNLYFTKLVTQGGKAADTLRGYWRIIDQTRDALLPR